jgi:hypothetical protein
MSQCSDDNTPGLYGINNSNRSYDEKSTWGKNQFNSSFPASLASYLNNKGMQAVYLIADENLEVVHDRLEIKDLFGLSPRSDDLYFSFESIYDPYKSLVDGGLPRVDLVTKNISTLKDLMALEIKLTALPDNSTFNLQENKYGTEIVIRPDTIVYLACSIAKIYEDNLEELKELLYHKELESITEWSDTDKVLPYIPRIIETLDKVLLNNINMQTPLILQPIWKTDGKSSKLVENSFDVFVWSNYAFTKLFSNISNHSSNRISRLTRTIIWLYKMLNDFVINRKIHYDYIIDTFTYGTKNDKAFSVNGKITHPFMACNILTNPRIEKNELNQIILNGGQDLLSPERRLDAIIYFSSDLFG